MPSGLEAFLFSRWLMISSISQVETSWGMLYFAWYSLSYTLSKSKRSACTGGGKNLAARIATFSRKSAVGVSWAVLLSGGSWGRGLGLPTRFLVHLDSRQRSPVLSALFEA